MIINYPTGYYLPILPKQASDSASVTYTISGSPPPRPALTFIKLPEGIRIKPKPSRVYNQPARRDLLGRFVLNDISAARNDAVYGAKQYSPGQVLDFDASDIGAATVNEARTTTLRHDVNALDLDKVGFTTSEQDALRDYVDGVIAKISVDLNVARVNYNSIINRIDANQKSINETSKAIGSLTVSLTIVDNAVMRSALARLQASLNDLKIERDQLITASQTAADLIESLNNQLRTVSPLTVNTE